MSELHRPINTHNTQEIFRKIADGSSGIGLMFGQRQTDSLGVEQLMPFMGVRKKVLDVIAPDFFNLKNKDTLRLQAKYDGLEVAILKVHVVNSLAGPGTGHVEGRWGICFFAPGYTEPFAWGGIGPANMITNEGKQVLGISIQQFQANSRNVDDGAKVISSIHWAEWIAACTEQLALFLRSQNMPIDCVGIKLSSWFYKSAGKQDKYIDVAKARGYEPLNVTMSEINACLEDPSELTRQTIVQAKIKFIKKLDAVEPDERIQLLFK